MEQLGINSNVYAGGKIFHIQTAGSLMDLSMQSEVFDSGRVVMVHKKKLDGTKPDQITKEQFRDFLKAFHDEIAWEIELLFFIRDRIHTIKHAISNNKMGLLFLHKGLVEEAIIEFEHAIEKSPDMVGAYNNLGLAYIQKGAHEQAIAVLKKSCEMEPRYADLRNNLGYAYLRARMYPEATMEFENALTVNNGYVEAHLNRAVTNLESIIHAPADTTLPSVSSRKFVVQELFQKTLPANPEFANFRFFSFRFEKILKQLQADDFAACVETINEIKEAVRKPNLDETIHGFYLKFLFGGAGKDEKVLSEYRLRLEKAVEENPMYADLRNSLGIVYLIQCRNLFIKAMGEFKRAYEINPSYKNAYKNFRLVHNDGREFLNLLRAVLK
jgi:tetratricopeptide (TPR) repeat protein